MRVGSEPGAVQAASPEAGKAEAEKPKRKQPDADAKADEAAAEGVASAVASTEIVDPLRVSAPGKIQVPMDVWHNPTDGEIRLHGDNGLVAVPAKKSARFPRAYRRAIGNMAPQLVLKD